MAEIETVTVACPDTIPGSFGKPCPGEYTVEYHPRTPPLFRVVAHTCQHPEEPDFDVMPVWTRAAGQLYDLHQRQKAEAQAGSATAAESAA